MLPDALRVEKGRGDRGLRGRWDLHAAAGPLCECRLAGLFAGGRLNDPFQTGARTALHRTRGGRNGYEAKSESRHLRGARQKRFQRLVDSLNIDLCFLSVELEHWPLRGNTQLTQRS